MMVEPTIGPTILIWPSNEEVRITYKYVVSRILIGPCRTASLGAVEIGVTP